MSKIRHPKKGASDVEYSTFDGGQYRIKNRIESFCTPLIITRSTNGQLTGLGPPWTNEGLWRDQGPLGIKVGNLKGRSRESSQTQSILRYFSAFDRITDPFGIDFGLYFVRSRTPFIFCMFMKS